MIDGYIQALRSQIVSTSGGFLRNPVVEGTCERCFTPTGQVRFCPACDRQRHLSGLPDAIGFMTYASHGEPIQQSGRVMRGYKGPVYRSANAFRTVSLLAALALKGHRECVTHIVGVRPSAWAAVPSLPDRSAADHPLTVMLRGLARPNSVEIRLRGVTDPPDPRVLDGANFIVQQSVPRDAHVLLVDDTWASGAHVQSAALALREAGARYVSALVLARWLSIGWGATTMRWMKDNLTGSDYDPTVCPWTQARCPIASPSPQT